MDPTEDMEEIRKPFTFLGMTFAPLNTPFRRRIQTIGALHLIWWWLFSSVVTIVLLYNLLHSETYRWIPILYISFIIYDSKTPHTGGRKWLSARSWNVWYWTGEYFPIRLIKTAELDPDKNYILGSHPHNIFCLAAFFCFCTDAGGWNRLFAGIKRRLVGLNLVFWFPSFREIALSSGLIAASKDSIEYVLKRPKSGVTAIMVGGAQEALNSNDNKISLIVNQRRGFVKLALKHGASLLPSFTFGEQKVYTIVSNPEGSKLRRFQELVKRWVSFSPVVFFGRGVFQYTFGLLPKRHPIHCVIGSPIHVEQVDDPTNEQIAELHARYVSALKSLYNEYNQKYGDPKIELEIN